jgi:hypothetical protein
MFIKLVGLGPINYLRFKTNLFDGLICIISSYEIGNIFKN